MDSEENRVELANALQKAMVCLNKIGNPFIIAIQFEPERKKLFPGMLMFNLPTKSDTSLLLAAVMLKDGFEEGFKHLVPGATMIKMDPREAPQQIAEIENSDDHVRMVESMVPKQYVCINGKEEFDFGPDEDVDDSIG